MLFHLFMHSLVDSCMCPDYSSNLQPWRIGTGAPVTWAPFRCFVLQSKLFTCGWNTNFLCHHNKLPQTYNNTKKYSTVPRDQKSKIILTRVRSRCRQGWFFLEALKKNHLLTSSSFQRLPALLGSWPRPSSKLTKASQALHLITDILHSSSTCKDPCDYNGPTRRITLF